MENHNCVRNPETGCCYVCRVYMRLNAVGSPLDKAIDATMFPKPPAPPARTCTCGTVIKASETHCVDCWIAEQTKQPAPKPKPVKQTKPAQGAITLESIIEAMTQDQTVHLSGQCAM
jgi:hypothetical protein